MIIEDTAVALYSIETLSLSNRNFIPQIACFGGTYQLRWAYVE